MGEWKDGRKGGDGKRWRNEGKDKRTRIIATLEAISKERNEKTSARGKRSSEGNERRGRNDVGKRTMDGKLGIGKNLGERHGEVPRTRVTSEGESNEQKKRPTV